MCLLKSDRKGNSSSEAGRILPLCGRTKFHPVKGGGGRAQDSAEGKETFFGKKKQDTIKRGFSTEHREDERRSDREKNKTYDEEKERKETPFLEPIKEGKKQVIEQIVAALSGPRKGKTQWGGGASTW